MEIAGVSVLERLAGALHALGVTPLSVILGPYTETLLPLARRAGLQPLLHARPDAMLEDSQRLALQHHLDSRPRSDLMLVLADLPLLDRAAIGPLLHGWWRRPPSVDALVPMVNGQRGHPVLLSSRAVHDLVHAKPWTGIRDWLAMHPGRIQAFPASGPAYVTDLDTPADLARLQKRLAPLPVAWPAGGRSPRER